MALIVISILNTNITGAAGYTGIMLFPAATSAPTNSFCTLLLLLPAYLHCPYLRAKLAESTSKTREKRMDKAYRKQAHLKVQSYSYL